MKWISVDDALPSNTNMMRVTWSTIGYDGSVVLHDGKPIRHYTIAIYLDGKWINEIGRRKTIKEKITHWYDFPNMED